METPTWPPRCSQHSNRLFACTLATFRAAISLLGNPRSLPPGGEKADSPVLAIRCRHHRPVSFARWIVIVRLYEAGAMRSVVKAVRLRSGAVGVLAAPKKVDNPLRTKRKAVDVDQRPRRAASARTQSSSHCSHAPSWSCRRQMPTSSSALARRGSAQTSGATSIASRYRSSVAATTIQRAPTCSTMSAFTRSDSLPQDVGTINRIVKLTSQRIRPR